MGFRWEAGCKTAWEENVGAKEEHPTGKRQAHLGHRISTASALCFPGLFCLLGHKLAQFQILYHFFFPLLYRFKTAARASLTPFLWIAGRMQPGILNQLRARNRSCAWRKGSPSHQSKGAWHDVLPAVIFPIRFHWFLAKVCTSHRPAGA